MNTTRRKFIQSVGVVFAGLIAGKAVAEEKIIQEAVVDKNGWMVFEDVKLGARYKIPNGHIAHIDGEELHAGDCATVGSDGKMYKHHMDNAKIKANNPGILTSNPNGTPEWLKRIFDTK